MFQALDGWDGLLLFGVVLVSAILSWQDLKTRQFSLVLWIILTALGVLWCLKQAFFPLTLLFMGLCAGLLALANRFIRPIIGTGDLLLFLTAGCFVPFPKISLFFILCGLGGILTYFLGKFWACFAKKSNFPEPRHISFVPALLLSLLITLGISLG